MMKHMDFYIPLLTLLFLLVSSTIYFWYTSRKLKKMYDYATKHGILTTGQIIKRHNTLITNVLIYTYEYDGNKYIGSQIVDFDKLKEEKEIPVCFLQKNPRISILPSVSIDDIHERIALALLLASVIGVGIPLIFSFFYFSMYKTKYL